MVEHEIGSAQVCLYNLSDARRVMARYVLAVVALVCVAASFTRVVDKNVERRKRLHVSIDSTFAVARLTDVRQHTRHLSPRFFYCLPGLVKLLLDLTLTLV